MLCFGSFFMADDYKPSVWQWVKEVVIQGATWVAVKVCQGIIFVVDGVAAGVEVEPSAKASKP
jgi:hypothetical protein